MDSFTTELQEPVFWVIMVFCAFGTWAALLQGRRIWYARSVAVLSVPFAWYNAIFYGILLAYGISHWRLALIVVGSVRGLSMLPIVAGMMKFHNHTRRERQLISLFILILLAIIVLPFRGSIFTAQAFIGLAFFLNQPYKIIALKETGVLEVRLFIVGFLSNAFWAWYGHAVGDRVVLLTSSMFAVSLLFTACLFLVYPEHNEKTAH